VAPVRKARGDPSKAKTGRPERAAAGRRGASAAGRAEYEDLLASLQDGILVLDREQRIRSLNPSAEELTGYAMSQVVGQPIATVFPAPSPLAALAAKTFALGRNHADFDALLVRADGQRVAVSVAVSLLSDRAGEPRGVVFVLRDLSRVRELEEQVRRSDRLAAIGVLAAGIAHEVRNPLVGIRAAAQLAEREPGFSAELREYTGMIIRQVDRLNRIVDDVLAFAGTRPLDLRPCNVNQILEEALRLEDSALRSRTIPVRRLYDPELPVVRGDPDRLLQVFLNLVRNASDALAGRAGALTVSTRFERVAPACGGRAAAIVDVIDQGPGIPVEVQERLFSPFFTTKDGGTGLGLPISLKIVEDHGGTIEVLSRPGEGSTFRVWLPVA
jgi:two-component system, NtrC family, nitrogen regulation sensor histidine kinase GlnL